MPDARAEAPPSARATVLQSVVVASLAGLCLGVLGQLYLGSRAAALAASACLIVFAVLGQRFIGRRERLLLVMALVVTVAAAFAAADFAALVERALKQAAFLAAFMILLALLRDGAATSPSVLAVGEYLTRQPPGRRYLAIHVGSHALGVILNFGALSLLGPLIKRGVEATRAANPAVAAIREQRQMSALVRGFSWIIAWSPTAVSQALVSAVVAGVASGRVALMGAAVAVIVLGVGWLDDQLRGARARARLATQGLLPTVSHAPLPARDMLRFSGVFLSLACLTGAIILSAGVATVPALMLAAPIVTAAWVWIQNRDAPAAARGRLHEIATDSVPNSSPEALTLGTAGYCGIMAAGLTDARAFADIIGLDGLSPIAVYLAVAALVPLASNAALPPMLVVTFLGSLFSALPGSPLDPTMLALSFVLGWTLNLTASPFGATALILSRVTGIPGTTLSWRWNGPFSLSAYAVVAAALILFSHISG